MFFTGVFDCTTCTFRVLDYVWQTIAVVFDALALDYSLRIMFFCVNNSLCLPHCCSILCSGRFCFSGYKLRSSKSGSSGTSAAVVWCE